MSIVPVEFERACERRWIAKYRQPSPVAPLYEVEDAEEKEVGEANASSSKRSN
jgi:hypothetical protein